MSDSTLLAELARQHEAQPPVRDRLTASMFLVGSLHALVILGVSFAPAADTGSSDAQSLEVLLVHNPVAEETLNTRADYLAQVNQRGAGTAPDARGAETPRPAADAAPDGADGSGPGAATASGGDDDVVASSAASRDKRFFRRSAAPGSSGSTLVAVPLAASIGNDDGNDLRLKGHAERELLVVANTRESSVAVYLDGWRRKIERIGTANYPMEAVQRAGLTGSPVLEVQILADGRLGEALVRRSSGHPELDQAAVAILRLAAPFEPFPRALAAQHDALRLSYEWQFLGGESVDSTVRMPANTR